MPEQRPQALRDVIARVVAGVIAARHALEMETKGARRVAARRALVGPSKISGPFRSRLHVPNMEQAER